MTDRKSIVLLYNEMYTAMINKNRVVLERVHDDSFVLIHMTSHQYIEKGTVISRAKSDQQHNIKQSITSV